LPLLSVVGVFRDDIACGVIAIDNNKFAKTAHRKTDERLGLL
jgi:hypothetical protein